MIACEYATIFGAGASELIHFGSQLIAARQSCAQLSRQVFAAVTLHDLFRAAAERGASRCAIAACGHSPGPQTLREPPA